MDTTPDTSSDAEHKEALGIEETVEYPADVEIGETFEIVVEGGRIEAFLSDNVFVLDPRSHHCRVALRAYAYSLAAEGHYQEARTMLNAVGREG